VNKMKWSRYNICYDCEDGNTLVFNSVTNALVCMESNLINEFKAGTIPDCKNEDLLAAGILAVGDEREKAIYILNKRKYSNESIAFWLYMTMDCNFKCYYCFESINNTLDDDYMTEKTALNVVDWCKDFAQKGAYKDVEFTLMGGEPLLNLPSIRSVCNRISESEIASNSKISIITNGSLLDRANVDAIVQCGVRYIQVTLDGLKNTHDRRRQFKDGSPSFQLIVQNIIDALNTNGDKLQITIRINIDTYNFLEIPFLLNFLEKIGLKKRVSICIGDTIHTGKNNSMHQKKFFNSLIEIFQDAANRGFNIFFSEWTPCWLSSERWFMIDCNGDIYKCPSFVGNKSFAVGNVFGEKLNNEYYRQVNFCAWEECLDCEYVGVCGGGCRFRRYAESGVLDGKKQCRKEYIGRIMEKYLLAKYIKIKSGGLIWVKAI